ncbi:MAG TPA: arginine deiminase-related protein [Stenotrophomonas sp.]|jgi:N-dimethylarginine dimethylaminohydrolase
MDHKLDLPVLVGDYAPAPAANDERAATRHRLLLCAPDHFGVDYIINPWMAAHLKATESDRARAQWQALQAALGEHAELALLPPAAGLPDLVFTANAGLVRGNDFLPSRFRHAERSGEEPLCIDWFRRAGYRIRPLPEPLRFEGAGDALFDRGRPALLWFGHGHRSDAAVAPELERMLAIDVVALRLVDPRFYHLDTCFCPLRDGRLLYYPPAFDDTAQAQIAARVPPHLRIAVSEADALAFACNAVDLDEVVVLNRASASLRQALAGWGYRTLETALDEFLKSGGAAKCLTLRLDE